MDTVVEKIFEFMKANKLTAKEVAVETGISASNFTEWKKGRSKPKLESLKAICSRYAIPLDYFTSSEYSGLSGLKIEREFVNTENLIATNIDTEKFEQAVSIVHNEDGTISLYISGNMIPELVKNKGPESQKIISSILNDLADMEEDELKRAKKVIEALK